MSKRISECPVYILRFDNNFLETDIAKGMFFKGKVVRFIHILNLAVDLG